MNRVFQPDVHPDAESLNAFIERALSQPERAQIVAHLGGCARCREVVFLAQAAAEADAAPVAAVKTESLPAKSGRTWWWAAFANWRIALIPAAALATATGLLIWVHTKSAPPAATVAQVALPPQSQMPSAAPPVPRPAQVAAASVAPPVAVQHAQPKAPRAERRNSPSETLNVNEHPANEQLPPLAPQLRAPDRFAADRNLSALASKQSDMNAGVISSLAIAPPPAPVPVSPNLAAVHGNLMSANIGGPRTLAAGAVTSSQMELMPQPVNGLAAMRLTSHLRLPSGLNAVSSAVMLDLILAVDPDGSVFLSRDAARHWERVPIQWTGKAVSVEAPPREVYPLNSVAPKDAALHTTPVATVSINPTPPAPAPVAPPAAVQSIKAAEPVAGASGPGLPPPPASADAAPPMPGMLFRLINDHHQTWISADGKVWHAQEGRE